MADPKAYDNIKDTADLKALLMLAGMPAAALIGVSNPVLRRMLYLEDVRNEQLLGGGALTLKVEAGRLWQQVTDLRGTARWEDQGLVVQGALPDNPTEREVFDERRGERTLDRAERLKEFNARQDEVKAAQVAREKVFNAQQDELEAARDELEAARKERQGESKLNRLETAQERSDRLWLEEQGLAERQQARGDTLGYQQQLLAQRQREFTPSIDALINQQIVSGSFSTPEGLAYINALTDFRDRPTSQQNLDAALAYARSPADVFTLSNIARGNNLMAAPPAGQTQRVGPPPDFLTAAYQRYLNSQQPFSGLSPMPPQYRPTPPVAASAISWSPRPTLPVDKPAQVQGSALAPAPSGMSAPGSRPIPGWSDLDRNIPNPRLSSPTSARDTAYAEGWGSTFDSSFGSSAPPAPSADSYDRYYGGSDSGYASAQEQVDDEATHGGYRVSADTQAQNDAQNARDDAEAARDFFALGGTEGPGNNMDILGEVGAERVDWPGGGSDIVGRRGPERMDLPTGTRVTPLGPPTRKWSVPPQWLGPGVDSYLHGGVEGPDDVPMPSGNLPLPPPEVRPPSSATRYPAGVQSLMAGRSLGRPGSLLRVAGLSQPSMQGWRNMMPSERTVYAELARLAGIPDAEFNRELMSTASGAGTRGPRYQPFRQRYATWR